MQRKLKRFDGDEQSLTVILEIVVLTSFNSFGDAFRKAAEYLDKDAKVIRISPNLEYTVNSLIWVKTEGTGGEFVVKLGIMRDRKEVPK